MKIELDDSRLSYMGRLDLENDKKPEFIFPASNLSFSFIGRKAVLIVTNRHAYCTNFVGAIIDGKEFVWKLNNESSTEIVLVDETKDEEHQVLFFKRQDSCHELRIEELVLSDGSELLPAMKNSERRIEVYGDSISAGEVCEAIDYVGKLDPVHDGEYSNSYYSYAWMCARKLGAMINNIAQGGIPLLKGTGWVADPIFPGMEYMWDKVHYYPDFNHITNWDFKKYNPQLVIIAIGQNDSHPFDFMAADSNSEQSLNWKRRYEEFVLKIHEKYPNAVIILKTSILCHDKSWDDAIDEVANKINNKRIRHFLYKRNGIATPGHMRIPEDEEMAEELTSYINELDREINIWND